MGLDASVFCDCVEKGRLRVPHPRPDLLYIDEDGRPAIPNGIPLEDAMKHDQWCWSDAACEHPNLRLVHHRLGYIGLIAFVRGSISRAVTNPSVELPVLWNQVIYSGTHGGDFLGLDDVKRLQVELTQIRQIDFSGVRLWKRSSFGPFWPDREVKISRDELELLRYFFTQLEDLVRASLEIQKPIAF